MPRKQESGWRGFGLARTISLSRSTRNTVELLKKHGVKPVFDESTGGHTWINWRNYLNDFAPQLFTAAAEKKSEHAATERILRADGEVIEFSKP